MTAEEHGLTDSEFNLLSSYRYRPKIWDAMSIFPTVVALSEKGLIEPVGSSGAYQLTESGRRVLGM